MTKQVFRYVRPDSLTDALDALAEGKKNVCVLAGGQSLVPRLTQQHFDVSSVIDINYLPDLSHIEIRGDILHVGALCRHADLERSQLLKDHNAWSVISEAASRIGMYAIRTRGTIGGSLAYAHPAAELPLVAVALGAQIQLRSMRGYREITSRDFFLDGYITALDADELITGIRFPAPHSDALSAFVEIAPRQIGWAEAAACGVIRLEDELVADIVLVVAAATTRPMRLPETEQFLNGKALRAHLIAEAGNLARAEAERLGLSDTRRRILVRSTIIRILEKIGERR